MTRNEALELTNKFYTGGASEREVEFARFVAAAECNKLAAWMIQLGFATGHGDATEDLLKELEWQIQERAAAIRARERS